MVVSMCCIMAFLLSPVQLFAGGPYSYKIVSTVYAADPIPDNISIVEITADDYCPHIYPVYKYDGIGEGREIPPPANIEYCSFVGAGTIRIIVYNIPPRGRVKYTDVLSHAKDDARQKGVHGLLFETVQTYDNGCLWFDFMGVYRKGEAPPGFVGLK